MIYNPLSLRSLQTKFNILSRAYYYEREVPQPPRSFKDVLRRRPASAAGPLVYKGRLDGISLLGRN